MNTHLCIINGSTYLLKYYILCVLTIRNKQKISNKIIMYLFLIKIKPITGLGRDPIGLLLRKHYCYKTSS